MTWMQAVVVVLFAASALLPLCGLFGLYRDARRVVLELSAGQDTKNPDTGKWQVTDFMKVMTSEVKNRPANILFDFVLIGGGVVCGAVASIWSLFPIAA
jgi:hypothetical protein